MPVLTNLGYDKFKSLPNAQHYLRSEASFEKLDAIESEHSDNQFAKRMVTNRNDLWISLAEQTA